MSSEENELSKFLEEYECAVIPKFPSHVENMSAGSYSEVLEYAKSDEYRNKGFVPLEIRCRWDKIVCGSALKLRFSWADSEGAVVIVNTRHKCDFFDIISKMAMAFNHESIFIKESGTQDAYRVMVKAFRIGCSPKEPIGNFVSNVSLAENARQAVALLGKTGSIENEDDVKENFLLCFDSWDRHANISRLAIDLIVKDFMKEMNFCWK